MPPAMLPAVVPPSGRMSAAEATPLRSSATAAVSARLAPSGHHCDPLQVAEIEGAFWSTVTVICDDVTSGRPARCRTATRPAAPPKLAALRVRSPDQVFAEEVETRRLPSGLPFDALERTKFTRSTATAEEVWAETWKVPFSIAPLCGMTMSM